VIASRPRGRAVLPMFLAGGCARLGALLALELGSGSLDEVAVPPSHLTTAPRQETVPPTSRMPPLASLHEVVDRPLFSESRRPPRCRRSRQRSRQVSRWSVFFFLSIGGRRSSSVASRHALNGSPSARSWMDGPLRRLALIASSWSGPTRATRSLSRTVLESRWRPPDRRSDRPREVFARSTTKIRSPTCMPRCETSNHLRRD
jgi:hypothetical protein